MDYRLLGPLTIRAVTPGQLGGPRERKLLAAMLLSANHPVSTEHLVDVVWPESPPVTARQQVQNCIGSLRRRMRQAGLQSLITRGASAYVLETSDQQVDVLVFRRLCEEAERSAATGQLRAACRQLKTALDLWRGRVLEDIDATPLAGRIAGIEEGRIRAIERYVQLMFADGRAAEVVEDLSSWVRDCPYHETLHAYLAEGLERAGRTAEALHAISTLKARLRGDLAISAGSAINEIELRLLAGRSAPSVARVSNVETDPIEAMQAAVAQLSAAVHLLAASLRSASGSPPQHLAIEGWAGIG